ncbi:MAG TPA: sigma-70 family RNA polymerase sigma factor [Chthoniobacterales bacterium]
MISSPARENVTRMLIDWGKGDPDAPARLMPFVYEELRQLARQYLQRERSDHTLQATGLVHEAYLRLVDQSTTTWQNRAHFFGVAAQVMRRVLVDYARAHRAEKRSGGWDKLAFDEALTPALERGVDLIALDDALKDLLAIDPRQSQIVELRFFGGLTNEEIGEVLDVSPSTVKREWRLAKAWLRREIVTGENDAAGR